METIRPGLLVSGKPPSNGFLPGRFAGADAAGSTSSA
jgi:hypothetical protein